MKKIFNLMLASLAVMGLFGCEDPVVTSKMFNGIVTKRTTVEVCSKWCHDYPAILIEVPEQNASFKWRIYSGCNLNDAYLGNYKTPVMKYLTEGGIVSFKLTPEDERILLFDMCN